MRMNLMHNTMPQEEQDEFLIDGRLGIFRKYLSNPEITDVDVIGIKKDEVEIWVRDIYMKKWRVDNHGISPDDIITFTSHVANIIAKGASGSKAFNWVTPKLEMATDKYRITCVHESVAVLGRVVCIRKTSKMARLNYHTTLMQKYCDEQTLNLILNCVRSKFNIVICGEPGLGKTEFAKMLSLYIRDEERVVTIEDSVEWHYKDLKPEANCISLCINEKFSYTDALTVVLRLNPDRVMLAEVRGEEVKYLVLCWTGNAKGITTVHTDAVEKIADRFLNMMPSKMDADRMENDIYANLDMGILLKKKYDSTGNEYRCIEEIGFFSRIQGENKFSAYMLNGAVCGKIPEDKLSKLHGAGIVNLYDIDKKLKERTFEHEE